MQCVQWTAKRKADNEAAGWRIVSGPYFTEAQCLPSCTAAPGAVSVVRSTQQLCTTAGTVTFQGTGFLASPLSGGQFQVVNLFDSSGNYVPNTVVSSTPTSITLSLVPPLLQGLLQVEVSNTLGDSGTPVQIAQCVVCSTPPPPSSCRPLPQAVILTIRSISCACGNGVSITLIQGADSNFPLDWFGSVTFCGATVYFYISCVESEYFVKVATTPGVFAQEYEIGLQLGPGPIIQTGIMDLSGLALPGGCGIIEFSGVIEVNGV
jgi:hypothetical protein